MEMNMKQFKYVLVLANEGTFSKAAEELNISQPSLSQYIKKIETQVGMELFYRGGSFVRLTDAGKVYLSVGKQILDLEHRLESSFSDIAQNKKGSVIIGVSPYVSASVMPSVAKEFQSIYPGMFLDVEEDVKSKLIERLEHGEFDFCLTVLPVDTKLFSYEHLADEELVLAVPAEYDSFNPVSVTGRKYPAIDVKAIQGKKFVMIPENQIMQIALEKICSDYDIQVQKAGGVKSLFALISMVSAGVGLALVPNGIEKLANTENVHFYSFIQELPKREIIAARRKDRPLSIAAQTAVDILKKTNW